MDPSEKSAGAGHRAVSLHRDCVLVLHCNLKLCRNFANCRTYATNGASGRSSSNLSRNSSNHSRTCIAFYQARRTELVSLELYEGKSQSNNTMFSRYVDDVFPSEALPSPSPALRTLWCRWWRDKPTFCRWGNMNLNINSQTSRQTEKKGSTEE